MSSPEEFFRRVPRAREAAAPEPTSGLRYWRSAWDTRHSLLAAALLVVIFGVNGTVTGWPADPTVLVLLAVASALAAVIGASYLPPRKAPAASSACAAGPLILTVAATLLLGRAPADPGGVLFTALLLLPALGLRAFGPTTCPS